MERPQRSSEDHTALMRRSDARVSILDHGQRRLRASRSELSSATHKSGITERVAVRWSTVLGPEAATRDFGPSRNGPTYLRERGL